MRSAETVHIDSHAAATLRYIRASIDGASSLAAPGSASLAVGVVGSLAAPLSSLDGLRAQWLFVWIGAAVVAASLGGALMLRQWRVRGLELDGAPLRRFAACYLPALAAGAVLTAASISVGATQHIAGMWLMLYGCALLAASSMMTRSVAVLGAAFFLLGSLTLFAPPAMHILLLGVAFGGFHLLFGLLARRDQHGR